MQEIVDDTVTEFMAIAGREATRELSVFQVMLLRSTLGLTGAKVLAVLLGLVGVALIVRPSGAGLNPGQLIALAAAGGFAVSVILVKSLTRSDSVVAIIFWMLVVQSVLGLVPALMAWRWPTPGVWAWVVGTCYLDVM